jgi:hypothetical protein
MYTGLVHPLYNSFPLPLVLKMTFTGFNVSYSYMCGKYIDHFHPPLPSSFTLPFLLLPTPSHDLLYLPVLHCSREAHCSVGFCRGISPVNILSFNQSHPSISLPYPSPPSRFVQHLSVCFFVPCSYKDVIYFNIIHPLSFSFPFSLPPLPLKQFH